MTKAYAKMVPKDFRNKEITVKMSALIVRDDPQKNQHRYFRTTRKQGANGWRSTVLQHPPYSPDLTLCEFYLYPKVKNGRESMEQAKSKRAEL